MDKLVNYFYYGNNGLCKTCKHSHCGDDNYATCDECEKSFSACPCYMQVEDTKRPCKFYEMDFPKDEIFESIKRGFKAYLIGGYGTEKEKRDFTEFAYCDLELMNKPNLTRLETRKVLTATIKLAFYHLGEMENEN